MKTIGVAEGLKLQSQLKEPAVTILCPARIQPNFVRDTCQKAVSLISQSYSASFVESCRSSIQESLHELIHSTEKWKGCYAMYWSRNEQHLVKLPVKVEKTVIVADSFHIKPLVASSEIAGSFVAVAEIQGKTEVLKVHPTRIEQLGTVNPQPVQEYFDLEQAELMALVLEGMQEGPLPILLHGSTSWMNGKARQLSSLGCVTVRSSNQGQLKANEGNFFKLARKAMDSYFARRLQQSIRRLYRMSSFVRRIDGEDDVGKALAQGRVQELFVADSRYIWGLWNEDGTLEKHHKQEDAVDGDILDKFVQLARRRKIPVHVVSHSKLPQGASCSALTSVAVPNLWKSIPISPAGSPVPCCDMLAS